MKVVASPLPHTAPALNRELIFWFQRRGGSGGGGFLILDRMVSQLMSGVLIGAPLWSVTPWRASSASLTQQRRVLKHFLSTSSVLVNAADTESRTVISTNTRLETDGAEKVNNQAGLQRNSCDPDWITPQIRKHKLVHMIFVPCSCFLLVNVWFYLTNSHAQSTFWHYIVWIFFLYEIKERK